MYIARPLAHRHCLTLTPTAPFNFDASLHKPDHFPSADNAWKPGFRWQTMLWQGKALPGVAVDTKAGLITATVPAECFAPSGQYDIVINDPETTATSQIVQFQVK